MPRDDIAPAIAGETADAVEILPGRADAGLVLVCDHASNAVPATYGTLGLPSSELERHIAYDIGAEGVTRLLSAMLGVPAVLTRWSRLLIDVNRGEDDPTLIMRLSDGAIIPGNRNLDTAERERRIASYYRPYDDAISRVVAKCRASGRDPALLGMHSFTERFKGVDRPWAASILWEPDGRLALPLLAGLRETCDLVIGENEPYAGQYEGDTLWRHGARAGLAHAIIEIRQDLIRDEAGQKAWAQRLASLLESVLAGNRDLWQAHPHICCDTPEP